MENKSLENRVWEKLEKKMSIDNFVNKENINKKGDVKMKIKYMPKVASFSILAVFLVGNVYIYATENKNIFTWMFDRIGISKKYEENSIDVNESKTNNDYTLTLENYGLDKDTLIMSFDLKFEENFDFKFVDEQVEWTQYFYEKFEIVDENNDYAISDDKIIRMFDKVSDNEYKIYEICKIDSEKINENSKLKINIGIDKFYYGPAGETEKIAKWDFEVGIDSDKINMEYEEYSLNNKVIVLEESDKNESEIQPEVELLNLKKSNLATKLTMYLKEYYTEPSIEYTVEILDENDNVILDKDIEYLIGGFKQDIIIRDMEADAKLKINVYEKSNYDGKIFSKGSIEIDLAKDLAVKPKEKINKASMQWRDLEFEYNENAEVSTEEYQDGMHYLGFGYKEETGRYNEFWIQICSYEDEIGFTDLEKLAQALKSLVYLGNYPLKSEIEAFLSDENGEFTEEVVFTFEEMMKIAENKTVTKNGKTYSIKDFVPEDIEFSDTEKVKLDNGNIEAVKYLNKSENCIMYILEIESEIYEIKVPSDLEYSDEVREFVNNMKLIK